MTSSYGQFVVVLLIFVGVLAVTFFVTKWMSGYQSGRKNGSNIELIESAPLSTGKYIQIVRLGERYYALAVSKDNVTLIGELDRDSLIINDSGSGSGGMSFKDIISKVSSASGSEAHVNEEKE
ncbi:MAG: flagellar biosynthetic protein FliO [Lachnospiraceae bacterium]|nr:flagellar biosynthetic protein FliO [Lachnospiraceae bacterium]